MFETLYIIAMMLFLFGITIFVHEWGHFIVARKCGLVVQAFSIGMGPALWKKEIDGIVYKIGLFPIGGYVSLPQLDPAGMEKVQGDNNIEGEVYPDISPWKKIAVAVAGPLLNIIFALFLALIVTLAPSDGLAEESGVFVAQVEMDSEAFAAGLRGGDEINAVNGHPVSSWYETRVECLLSAGEDQQVELTVDHPEEGSRQVIVPVNHPDKSDDLIDGVFQASPCQVLQIVTDSPAERAGLLPDDILISLDGIMVQGTSHFIELVQSKPDDEAVLVVEREGEFIPILITPEYDPANEKVMIGIYFGGALSLPWSLTGNPLEQISSDASSIFRLLKALTTPGQSKQAASGLGGPVAIFTMIWISLKMSLITAIGLTRFININLAVLNLLPLPVLDGGHICFALWEGITRRKVHPIVVGTLVNTFAILLISAMLFLSWRDVERNWNVTRFFKKAPAEQTISDTPIQNDSIDE
jgi:regulator of sigma E protease